MGLNYIHLYHLRNIKEAILHFSPYFNFITGTNGSGKTTILEAIYLLNQGRSFRTHLIDRLISHGHSSFVIQGLLNNQLSIGLEKSHSGQVKIRINNETKTKLSDLAVLQPLQLIHAASFILIDDSPKYRRQYMDWGLFHVEPSFLILWKKFNHILAQRNAALRRMLSEEFIVLWDKELEIAAIEITKLRQSYLEKWLPIFHQINASLSENELEVIFYQGWPEHQSYKEVLHNTLAKDKQLQYTSHGPHRADLIFKINNKPMSDIGSRGQKKLLIYALSLAQGVYLYQQTQKSCLYLLDDLPSELDLNNQKRIMNTLIEQKAQAIITGLNCDHLISNFSEACQMFHVEQGQVQAMQTCE